MLLKLGDGYASNAVISSCGKYRYLLQRGNFDLVLPDKPPLFVMLNPSTADATEDDPTIRRIKGFCGSWGNPGFYVANLYALRSTNPSDLWKTGDPVGPENDKWLKIMLKRCSPIICAWGNHAKSNRVRQFVMMASGHTLQCLGTNKSGSPKHPLYIAGNTETRVWNLPT